MPAARRLGQRDLDDASRHGRPQQRIAEAAAGDEGCHQIARTDPGGRHDDARPDQPPARLLGHDGYALIASQFVR
jgi:hypothetical protein